MKLYTRPRPIDVWRLRSGDQIAIGEYGRIVDTEAAYMDADIAERLTWSTVHALSDVGCGVVGLTMYEIHHTLGQNGKAASQTVIMREVIELDPS